MTTLPVLQSASEPYAVINALPKVSLHDHLEGSVRLGTVLELSQRDGLPLPADNLSDLRAWFDKQKTSRSLVKYLLPFEHTFAILQTEQNLHRAGREYVEDLAADGVLYAEVRWAPEAANRRGLSMDAAIEALADGLATGMREQAAKGRTITVVQIISALRQNQDSLDVARAALRHRWPETPAGVVAFDLAGPEAGYLPSLHQEALDLVAHSHLNVTLHAGEADGPNSISDALINGRAQRLGHGVRIAQDIVMDTDGTARVGPLAQRVRDRGTPLETSPSSNLHTGACDETGSGLRDHPFDLLYRLGFHVTVNTDNRLMSDTTLTNELDLLRRTFGYEIDDLLAFQLNAASASFLDHASRVELEREISDGFARVVTSTGSHPRRPTT